MNEKDQNKKTFDEQVANRKVFRLKSKIEKYNEKIDDLREKIEEVEYNTRPINTIKFDNKDNEKKISIANVLGDSRNSEEVVKQNVNSNILHATSNIEQERARLISEANKKAEAERMALIEEANMKANVKLQQVKKAYENKPLENIEVKKDVPQKENIVKKEELKENSVKVTNNTQTQKAQPSDIKKKMFKYTARNTNGDLVKGMFEAYLKEEVEAYLKNERYEIIKVKESKDINITLLSGEKLKAADISFMSTQLSTYLKAGIPLIDAVKILERQATKADKKKIFSNVAYELTKGENFSTALERQKNVFPKLYVNMMKASELTGDLPSALDDMTDYYTSIDKTKKAMVSAMMYPICIFIFSLIVVSFVLIYVVPKFESMFNQSGMKIPTITTVILSVSSFLKNNLLWVLLIIIALLLLYIVLFRTSKGFRKAMQTIYMKLPGFGNIIIYKEVHTFTKTFASLLNHNVFITQSMDILSTISENEVYKEIINKSLDYLAKGAKISDSFKGEWAFPVIAYEMLVTGENTGRLGSMMEYVANYYEDLHSNAIKRLNTFIEPVMIVFLAISVGVILLAIVIPMFSYYSQMSGV